MGSKGIVFRRRTLRSHLDGNVAEGTVVSAECCYGAELYNPADAQGQAGICNTYLRNNPMDFSAAPRLRMARVSNRAAKLTKFTTASFAIQVPVKGAVKAAKLRLTDSATVHLVIGSRRTPDSNVRRTVVVAATVGDGEVLRLRRLHSR